MKALEILNVLRQQELADGSTHYTVLNYEEAIEELEALELKYDTQEVYIQDLKSNYEAQEIIIADYKKAVNLLESIISDLKKQREPKTCIGCVFEDYKDSYWVCCVCSRNVSDKYEPKENND